MLSSSLGVLDDRFNLDPLENPPPLVRTGRRQKDRIQVLGLRGHLIARQQGAIENRGA